MSTNQITPNETHFATSQVVNHRSTAYVQPIDAHYWRNRRKVNPITPQFRFVVRMAVACHAQGIPYDMAWTLKDSVMAATVSVSGKVPTPKALPKEPKLRLVPAWKPAIWDAEYRLNAYHDVNLQRKCPGFVIEHSSGLSLVHCGASASAELGITEYGADEDPQQDWRLTHTASGYGFGVTLNFKRATQALLLATSFPVEWMQPFESLRAEPVFLQAGNAVVAAYGNGHQKDQARQKLIDLERAA